MTWRGPLARRLAATCAILLSSWTPSAVVAVALQAPPPPSAEREAQEAAAVASIERMVSESSLAGRSEKVAGTYGRAQPRGAPGEEAARGRGGGRLVAPLFRPRSGGPPDHWCDDTAGVPMFEGAVSDHLSCEDKCGQTSRCGYYSFFEASRYCLLTEECGKMSPSKERVKVFAKVGGPQAGSSTASSPSGGDAGGGDPSAGKPDHDAVDDSLVPTAVPSQHNLHQSDDFYDAAATFRQGAGRGSIVDLDPEVLRRIAGLVLEQLGEGSGPGSAAPRSGLGMLQRVARQLTASIAPGAEVTRLGAQKLVREALMQTILNASQPMQDAEGSRASSGGDSSGEGRLSPEEASWIERKRARAEAQAEEAAAEARRAQQELRALERDAVARREGAAKKDGGGPERAAAGEQEEVQRAAQELKRLERAGGGGGDDDDDVDELSSTALEVGAGRPAGGAEAGGRPEADGALQSFDRVKNIGQALGAAELGPRLSEAAWGELRGVLSQVASKGDAVAHREPEVAATILELVDALTKEREDKNK